MKTNSNLLTYFLTRTLFLGGGISMMYEQSQRDAYISCFLGTLLGIAIIYIFSYFYQRINMPLKVYLQKKSIINIILKIVYSFYIIFLMFIILIILSTFIYSYFLLFTPSFLSCLPFIFLACYKCPKISSTIYYIGFILLILSLSIIILKTSLLSSELNIQNILPIINVKPSKIILASFIYAILSTAPFLLTIGEPSTFNQNIKYYILASFMNLLVITTLILVLGDMVYIYSYPEYAGLRKIRFFNFIENIENFISISWFYDIFIALSLASLKIKDIFNTSKTNISFTISLITLFIVSKYISTNFATSIQIYKVFPFILFAAMLLILILLIIKTNMKKHND